MHVRGAVSRRRPLAANQPNDLALRHIPLVFSIVREAWRRIPSDADPDDLVGCGFLALARAARRFQPSRGKDFVSYAAPAIRGAVLDEARSRDWLSRGARRRVRELETTMDRLQKSVGRRATYADAARELNLSAQESRALQRALCCAAPVSVAESLDQGDAAMSHVPACQAESDPHEIVAERQVRRLVAQAVRNLPERERRVLHLYYFEEHTLREIGQKLGVTESRVCQIHGRAIRRLRQQPELAALLQN